MRLNKGYRIIAVIIVVVSLLSIFFFTRHPKTAPQFNVILITLDALRPDHLSCYGYKRNTSAHIDSLANEGVIFTQAISQSSVTIPSLPSLMTSLYPSQHGIVSSGQSYHSIQHPVLAQILREKGYYTAGVIAHTLSQSGLGTGFDSVDMAGYITADAVTKKAADFLDTNKGRKFFLWLHYLDTHGPYRPPPAYKNKYLKDNLYKSGKHIPISTFGEDGKYLNDNLSNAVKPNLSPDLPKGAFYCSGVIPRYVEEDHITDIDYYIAQYDAEINFADEQIGILLAKIKEMNLDKKTLIIITADHGEYMGEHGMYFSHGETLYDAVIRVPLIIKCDNVLPRGRIINEQVAHIDIMPTILDLLGIEIKSKVSGISLAPMILGKKKYPSRIILSELFSDSQNLDNEMEIESRSLRAGAWKLIYKSWGEKYKLYNLKDDPAESINLKDIKKNEFRYFRKILSGYNRKLPRRVKLGQSLDKETKEKLMSLGYLSGGQQAQQKEVAIIQGPLTLQVNSTERNVRIYSEGMGAATAGSLFPGVSTSFEAEGITYSSQNAVWKIDKIGAGEIILKLFWPNLALTQIWEIRILPDGEVGWKVDFEAERKIKIKKWNSSLMLPERYNKLVSVDESRKFVNTVEWENVILKDLTSRVIGAEGEEGAGSLGVIFVSESDSSKDIPVVRYCDRLKILSFYGSGKADGAILLPGRYNVFSGKIALMDKKEMDARIKAIRAAQESRKEKLRASSMIRRSALELFFDNGQGRIYYSGRELTNGFGLYTSLYSNDSWHDSQNVLWTVKKINDHKIIAQGFWIYLPISQNWELDLSADNTILWKIDMRVYDRVVIEKQQTNIMLLPGYKDWFSMGNGVKGKFSLGFDTREKGWRILYEKKDANPEEIAVAAVSGEDGVMLPSVVFDCTNMDKKYVTSIVDTDDIFKSRVLSCYKTNTAAETDYLQPGTYDYFNGKIKINVDP